jgi:hypothetical protein
MNTIRNSQELLQIVVQVDHIEGCPLTNEMELLSALSKCGVNWLTIDSLDRILTEMEHQQSLHRWHQQQALLVHPETALKTQRSDADAPGPLSDRGPKEVMKPAPRRRSTFAANKAVQLHRRMSGQAPNLAAPEKVPTPGGLSSRHQAEHQGHSARKASTFGAAQVSPPANLPPVKDRFPMERAAFLSLLLDVRGMEDERTRHLAAAASSAAPGNRRATAGSLHALRGRLDSDRLELVNAVEPQLLTTVRHKHDGTKPQGVDANTQPNVMDQVVRLLSPFSISKEALDDFLHSSDSRGGKISLMQFASWLVQEESKAEVLNTSERSKAAKARWKMAIDAVIESLRNAKRGLRSGFQDLIRRGALEPEERLEKAMQDAQATLDGLRASVPLDLQFPYSKQITAYDARQLHSSSVDEMLLNLCRSGPTSRVTSLGKVLTTLRKFRTAPAVDPDRHSPARRPSSAAAMDSLSPITRDHSSKCGSHQSKPLVSGAGRLHPRPLSAPAETLHFNATSSHGGRKQVPSEPCSPASPDSDADAETLITAERSSEREGASLNSQLEYWTKGCVARPQSTRGSRLLSKFAENFDEAKVLKQREEERDEVAWRKVLQESGRPLSLRSWNVLAARRSPVMVRIRM